MCLGVGAEGGGQEGNVGYGDFGGGFGGDCEAVAVFLAAPELLGMRKAGVDSLRRRRRLAG